MPVMGTCRGPGREAPRPAEAGLMLLGSTLRRAPECVNPRLRKVAHTWLNSCVHGFIPGLGQIRGRDACRFSAKLAVVSSI